ncbi:MAG: FAD-dependent oxidoreductase [Bryobacterales bacterium]|nr:FAD-dependent oxidoreductase [Bryobacterales bacterium]
MNRRDFSKESLLLGIGAFSAPAVGQSPEFYREAAKNLPARRFDVVVAGGGTAGVVAALAAARQGAKTVLIEQKGYTGGVAVEGGTALHSFFNLWKAFPGVEKRQVVKGIPQEIVDRLMRVGGCTGHAEMLAHYDYDSVCTAIDTELYKLVTMQMLDEAGVSVWLNTFLAGAIRKGGRVTGVIAESRSGREAIFAKAFVDTTGYGDLAAHAGAKFTEPNDYAVANSIGIGNVDIEKMCEFLREKNSLVQLARGRRSGKDDQIVRLGGESVSFSEEFNAEARKLGLSMITTTTHDNYFMFLKLNLKMPVSPTHRDESAKAELELRKRQAKAVDLIKRYVPGCERAFIARTSPSFSIRRGRLIDCDYDIRLSDILKAEHFDDDVFVYGFHDSAPRLKVGGGGTYGIPYRALRPRGVDNLLVAGMMITSNHDAHMSTRNTVSCMGQGQAVGTAAALCAARNCGTRDLPYAALRDTLAKNDVYFE